MVNIFSRMLWHTYHICNTKVTRCRFSFFLARRRRVLYILLRTSKYIIVIFILSFAQQEYHKLKSFGGMIRKQTQTNTPKPPEKMWNASTQQQQTRQRFSGKHTPQNTHTKANVRTEYEHGNKLKTGAAEEEEAQKRAKIYNTDTQKAASLASPPAYHSRDENNITKLLVAVVSCTAAW